MVGDQLYSIYTFVKLANFPLHVSPRDMLQTHHEVIMKLYYICPAERSTVTLLLDFSLGFISWTW